MNNVEIVRGQKPSQLFAHINPKDDTLGAGIGASYPVIGYRGKEWSVRVDGEEQQINSPVIDVVFLRTAAIRSKSYYTQYVPGQSDGQPPICASIDGILPDDGVRQRQAETCALCPRNQLKTDPQSGKRRKECSDYKRSAVLLVTYRKTDGAPLLEPVFLRVPAGSLVDLEKYQRSLLDMGFHSMMVVTRISFDRQESYPKFKYEIGRVIQTDQEAQIILQLVNDPVAQRITGEDVIGRNQQTQIASGESARRLPPPPAPAFAAAVPPPPQPPAPAAVTIIPPNGPAFGAPAVAQLPVEPVSFASPTGNTLQAAPAFAAVAPPSQTVRATLPAQTIGQTATDVATEVEEDPDLDSFLDGLVKS
jgi:hypothetical protein